MIKQLLKSVPLLQIKSFENNEVYSLLEKYNVGGSVKIKTVYRMIKTALEGEKLDSKKTLLEASSGNTAIAMAYLWNLRNLKVKIVLPNTVSEVKKNLITSYGANIVEIEWGTDDAIEYRNKLAKKDPGKYFLLDQFGNYANMDAHYNLTGPYLYEKLGKLDFFVAGLGTAGTALWTGKYLKEKNPDMILVGVNPKGKIEGLRDFETSDVHIPFYEENKHLLDVVINMTYEDSVEAGVKTYLQEWHFVGLSSGAILTATKEFLKWKSGLTWAIIAPDGGDFYLDRLKWML